MRIALGVVIGGILAALLIFVSSQLASSYFAGSIADTARFASAYVPDPMAEVPLVAKWVIVLGWFLAALLGAAVADVVAQRGVSGWIVAGGVVVYLLVLGVYVPHPAWMALCGVVLPLLAGFFARRSTGVPL